MVIFAEVGDGELGTVEVEISENRYVKMEAEIAVVEMEAAELWTNEAEVDEK